MALQWAPSVLLSALGLTAAGLVLALDPELILLRYTDLRLPQLLAGWTAVCLPFLLLRACRKTRLVRIGVALAVALAICAIWFRPSDGKKLFATFGSIQPGMTRAQVVAALEPFVDSSPWTPQFDRVEAGGFTGVVFPPGTPEIVDVLWLSGEQVYAGTPMDNDMCSADGFYVFFSEGTVVASHFGPD